MRSMVLVLSLCLPSAACSASSDRSSPRAVAESLALAMDRGDADAALGLMAPEERLRQAFDCGRDDALGRALSRAKDDMRPSFEELRATGVRVHFAGFDAPASEQEVLEVGDSWRDCVARERVEVARARVTLVYKKGARNDEDSERWDFVRLGAAAQPSPDDLWWFVPH